MSQYLIYAIGFLAQTLFFARTFVQWYLTESAKKVVTPLIYWQISVVASYLLMFYGWLREDFAILVGQFISYYVYIWNLKKNGFWSKISAFIRAVLLITPFFISIYLFLNWAIFTDSFFKNDNIPLYLLLYGTFGQILFSLRFTYQYIYSRITKNLHLPAGFWIISIIGSSIIITYGIIRLDPVIILGQLFGFLAYVRNLILHYREKKSLKNG